MSLLQGPHGGAKHTPEAPREHPRSIEKRYPMYSHFHLSHATLPAYHGCGTSY